MTEQTGAVTLSPNLSFMHDTMISLYRALIKAGKEEPYDPARFNDAHFHFNGAAQAYCAGIVDEAEHAKLSDGKRK